MKTETILKLNELNRNFYERNAESFSQTRQSAWSGWARLLSHIEHLASNRRPLRVLDVACGNLRFERFLAEELGQELFNFLACDNCDALVTGSFDIPCTFSEIDIVDELADGSSSCIGAKGAYDLVTCFGFFHHVPSAGMRNALLGKLIDAATPGGIVAISLWRYLENDALASKAKRIGDLLADGLAEELGVDTSDLEPGDAFLGWQQDKRTLRYCHSFDEAEIEGLVKLASSAARCIDSYDADGKSGKLNSYLLFERI